MTDFDLDPLVEPGEAMWVDMHSAIEVVDCGNDTTRSSENGQLWSSNAIWVVGMIGFGLPSIAMSPSFTTVIRFALLIVTIPAAFMFFGPYWNLVLFPESQYSDVGMYLFFVTCVCVPFLSVWLGFRDRRRLQVNLTDLTGEQFVTEDAAGKPRE